MLTEDPIQNGLNWYTYCNNNPLMLIDPFGLASVNALSYLGGLGAKINFAGNSGDKNKLYNITLNNRTFTINVPASGQKDQDILNSLFDIRSLNNSAMSNLISVLKAYGDARLTYSNVSYNTLAAIDPNAIKNGMDYMKQIYDYFRLNANNINFWSPLVGKYVKPDFWNDLFVGEIKYVKELYRSSQIEGMVELAQRQSKTFVLIIDRAKTNITPQLESLIIGAKGVIIDVAKSAESTPDSIFFMIVPDVELKQRIYDPNNPPLS